MLSTILGLTIAVAATWGVAGILYAVQKNSSEKLEYQKSRCTRGTTARVVHLQRACAKGTGASTFVYIPTFEYVVDNRVTVAQGELGSTGMDAARYQIGQLVPLFYDPFNPTHVYVPSVGKERLITYLKIMMYFWAIAGLLVFAMLVGICILYMTL